jgi:ubiquinone/menaquinone biosynthesis C-methylase UbiE
MFAEDLLRLEIKALPPNARILDVGCGPALIASFVKTVRPDVSVHGIDLVKHDDLAEWVCFATVNLEVEGIPYPANHFDLVLSRHVLEHLRNSTEAFGEMCRVTRAGGKLFVEAPSDRSTWFSFPWAQHWRLIFSFYDDPTHVGRPWSPQALYRMGLYWGMTPQIARYEYSVVKRILFVPLMLWGWLRSSPDLLVDTWWKALGWVAFCIYVKPIDLTEEAQFRYRSVKVAVKGRLLNNMNGGILSRHSVL